MGDGIDPQARRLSPADAAIEQVYLSGDFLEQRVERLVQQLRALRNASLSRSGRGSLALAASTG
jgi:hypothetical protein